MNEILDVEVIPVRLTNCRIIRPFFAGNSFGILVSKIVDEETIKRIKGKVDLKVEVLNSKYTAIGNLISCNDRGCIVSPLFNREEIMKISDTLSVEVVPMKINEATYVGSLLKANNRGGIISPFAKDDEIEEIRDVMKVRVYRGTVNSGVPFVSSGIIANDNGALVGELTDGIELINISEALGV